MAHFFLKAAILLVALFFISTFHAQSQVGTWENVNMYFALSTKWETRAELQLRSQRAFQNHNYIEYVFSTAYRLNSHISFFAGMGGYETFAAEGNFKLPHQQRETRVFEQMLLRTNVSRLRLETRMRIEQRWLINAYRNRFRIRINPIFPVNHPTIDKGTLYVSLSNETFFQPTGLLVDRNWLFGGAGYVLNNAITLQAGLIHQKVYIKTPVQFSNNFVQTTLQFRFRARHPHRHTTEH